jgi:hypothetical protein
MRAIKVGVEHVKLNPAVEWLILKLDYADLENLQLGIHPYIDLESASAEYIETEKRVSAGQKVDAVLVSVRSVDELEKAYPNYFGSLNASSPFSTHSSGAGIASKSPKRRYSTQLGVSRLRTIKATTPLQMSAALRLRESKDGTRMMTRTGRK